MTGVIVLHGDLNADMLAALLWDGIEIHAGDDVYDAKCAYEEVPSGYNFSFRIDTIKMFVRTALREFGTRSVECGSQSDKWNEAVAEWCAKQVKRAFKDV